MAKKPRAKKTVFRDLMDDQFVKEDYAKKNPDTTEEERVRNVKPKKKM